MSDTHDNEQEEDLAPASGAIISYTASLIRQGTHPMTIGFDSSHGALGEFVGCCTFVVSLCHTMLMRISERSSAGRHSFIQMGPIAFLNDRAA
jgi:hypothetical protein